MQALPSKEPNPSAFDGAPHFYPSVLVFDFMYGQGPFSGAMALLL